MKESKLPVFLTIMFKVSLKKEIIQENGKKPTSYLHLRSDLEINLRMIDLQVIRMTNTKTRVRLPHKILVSIQIRAWIT